MYDALQISMKQILQFSQEHELDPFAIIKNNQGRHVKRISVQMVG